MAKETDIFQSQNIAIVEFPVAAGSRFGSDIMRAVKEFQVGSGTKSFNANQSGIWLGAKTFSAAPFSVDMNGLLTASSIIITGGTMKYGKNSFTDSNHAGYYIGAEGIYFGSAIDATKLKYDISLGTFDYVGNVSGRASSVLASAIDSAGHFVDSNLNTLAKTILGDFTFGTYGAIKMITDSNNGLWISPTGILGKKAGLNTFAIGNDGSASFSGTITASTIISSDIRTSPVDMFRLEIRSSSAPFFSDSIVWVSQTNIDMGHIESDISGSLYISGQDETTQIVLHEGVSHVDFKGDIVPVSDSVYNVGHPDCCFANGYFDSLTLGGTSRSSWPVSFSGNLSDLTINTNKDWQGYNITQITQVIPHNSNTSFLGNPSYYWDWFYVRGIYGAGGVDPINIYNNVNFQSNNIQYCNDIDINGSIDCEGAADFNTYISVHGLLYMNNQPIRDVANPTNPQDAATKKWVEDNFTPL